MSSGTSMLFKLLSLLSVLTLGTLIVVGTTTLLLQLSQELAEAVDVPLLFASVIVFGSCVLLAAVHSFCEGKCKKRMSAEEQVIDINRVNVQIAREADQLRNNS